MGRSPWIHQCWEWVSVQVRMLVQGLAQVVEMGCSYQAENLKIELKQNETTV